MYDGEEPLGGGNIPGGSPGGPIPGGAIIPGGNGNPRGGIPIPVATYIH